MDKTTLPPVPQGMRHYELPAGEETLDFWGKFLSSTDTDSGDRSRWAELRLYRIIDTNPEHDDSLPEGDENKGMFGKQMWLLYTIGHSLVYHDIEGCSKGVVTLAGDFRERAEDPDELESCPECSPGDWQLADREQKFRLEITWYSYTLCQTAGKVIRSLYREPRCQNCRDRPHEGGRCRKCGCARYAEAPLSLSTPGRNLIEQVRKLDPDIDRAAAQVKRI